MTEKKRYSDYPMQVKEAVRDIYNFIEQRNRTIAKLGFRIARDIEVIESPTVIPLSELGPPPQPHIGTDPVAGIPCSNCGTILDLGGCYPCPECGTMSGGCT